MGFPCRTLSSHDFKTASCDGDQRYSEINMATTFYPLKVWSTYLCVSMYSVLLWCTGNSHNEAYILETSSYCVQIQIWTWISTASLVVYINTRGRMPSTHCRRFSPSDWHVFCWRPLLLQQPWIEIRKWVISASVAEGYTGIPSLATANIHTPIPPVELHLRNDHTPSLPLQTNKHTTHPTWYVPSFILCSWRNML